MAQSSIEWTEMTWNPTTGCNKISAGCKYCYAEIMSRRLEAMGIEKYKDGFKLRIHEDALLVPYGWKSPKIVFVNSMSDLFHERVSDAFILKVWNVMRATPHHHYQILTKRPDRMGSLVAKKISDVLPNVWLGTSIEDSEVSERANHLRSIPAAIRFISFEPLIGSVGAIDLTGIHWAIVGGESGRSARPVREEWIDEIFDQCSLQGVAFFFKQWGTWGKDNKRRSKKANGRVYRDQVWDQMPAASLTP